MFQARAAGQAVIHNQPMRCAGAPGLDLRPGNLIPRHHQKSDYFRLGGDSPEISVGQTKNERSFGNSVSVNRLRAVKRREVCKLLEHPEVVANCKVLNDLRVLETETMNVLDLELSAIRRERRTFQGRDQLKVAEVRARDGDFTHDGVLLRHQTIDSESEVRKCTSPDSDDVLDYASYIRVRDSEVREMRREELIDPLNLAFVPQHFKMLPDAFFVGVVIHRAFSRD